MEKISVHAARQPAAIGHQVLIQGWLRTRRDSKGGFSFLEINDGSCLANLQIIADGFNMLNRFNAADVDPLCDPTAGSTTCTAGQPTAALDPRTFQFALKLNW